MTNTSTDSSFDEQSKATNRLEPSERAKGIHRINIRNSYSFGRNLQSTLLAMLVSFFGFENPVQAGSNGSPLPDATYSTYAGPGDGSGGGESNQNGPSAYSWISEDGSSSVQASASADLLAGGITAIGSQTRDPYSEYGGPPGFVTQIQATVYMSLVGPGPAAIVGSLSSYALIGDLDLFTDAFVNLTVEDVDANKGLYQYQCRTTPNSPCGVIWGYPLFTMEVNHLYRIDFLAAASSDSRFQYSQYYTGSGAAAGVHPYFYIAGIPDTPDALSDEISSIDGYSLIFSPGFANVPPVPEPGSQPLLLLGLAAMTLAARHRNGFHWPA